MSYEFKYCVCRLSKLVNEKPVYVLPDAGFDLLEAVKKYTIYLKDGFNYTYIFLKDKPVFMLDLDGYGHELVNVEN